MLSGVRAALRGTPLRRMPSWRPGLTEQSWLAVGAALLIWGLSLPAIRLDRMSDLGLVSALPPSFYLAPLLLTVSYWRLTLQQTPPARLMLLHLVSLIVILQVTLPLLYGVARFGWTYKHVGVVDYVLQYGSVNPAIDAYHNWPGFFSLIAGLLRLTGIPNALELARWWPLIANLLYLVPLLLIYRSFTRQARVVWLALWLFFLGNWIGQDYFSPQSFAFFLFLFVLAVCLTWLSPRDRPAPGEAPVPAPTPGAVPPRALLLALLGAACLAIAASHQLTPFMLMGALVAVIVTGGRPLVWVLILTLILTVGWDAGMADTYLRRYSHWYSSLGQLEQNLEFNVDRVEYSPGHSLVVFLTRTMTLLLWGVAALGVLRGLREKWLSWRPALLAAAPFPMLVLGAYGGEMALRIYLFSLPFMAYLAATALYSPVRRAAWEIVPVRSSTPLYTYEPTPRTPERWEAAASLGLGLLMTAGLFFSAYGNERTNRVTATDVDAAWFVYTHAPPDSAIITFSVDSFPLKLTGNYPAYTHLPLVDDQLDRNVVLGPQNYQQLREELRESGLGQGYVIFTATQQTYAESNRILAPGAFDLFREVVQADPSARLIYGQGRTLVYRIRPAPSRVPR